MMVRAWFRAECGSVPTEVGSLCRVCIATGKRSALPSALKVSVEGSPQLSRALSLVMLDRNVKPERSWQDIVAAIATASRCHQIERIADLRRELESVPDERKHALCAKARSENKLPIQDKAA